VRNGYFYRGLLREPRSGLDGQRADHESSRAVAAADDAARSTRDNIPLDGLI
jgi:hypothetical protein